METPEEILELTEEEINLKIGEVIMGAIGEIEPKETEPITLTYEQKDGTWSEAKETEDPGDRCTDESLTSFAKKQRRKYRFGLDEKK